MIVTLNRDDIKFCNDLSLKRGKMSHSGWQQNDYRRGLSNNDNDTCAAERRGLYGEKAFSKIVECAVINEDILDNGDKGFDFIIAGKKIDVKFQLSLAHWAVKEKGCYGPLYISAENKFGNEKTYSADVFFFTCLNKVYINDEIVPIDDVKKFGEDRQATSIEINMLGYINKKDLLANKEIRKNLILKKSNGKGNQYNYYVKIEELKSTERMLNVIRNNMKKEV